MDLVSQLLNSFHLNASVFIRGQLCGQWRLQQADPDQATFHLVLSGECWLHRPGDAAPLRLEAGDLLILPRDAAHALSDAPTTTTDAEPLVLPLSSAATEGTGILCGHIRFDQGVPNPLLDALPDYWLLATRRSEAGGELRQIIDWLIFEAEHEAPGFETMIDRLSDALFIQAIRIYLADNDRQTGLAAALADPPIGRALHLIHDHPEARYTVAGLAHAVAMSRSNFIRRFGCAMGEAPKTYINRWRMHLAYRWLRAGETVATVTQRCGYTTEAGFSKAFKHHYALGPGAVRRAGRDPQHPDSR